jgi:hypothetical protein
VAPFVSVARIAGPIFLSIVGQVEPPAVPAPKSQERLPARTSPGDRGGAPAARRVEAEVEADRLDVFDRPEETAYAVGQHRMGDRVRVRVDRIPRPGWLAIDPPPTSICWVDESSLELDGEGASDRIERALDPGGDDRGTATRAWVVRLRAVVRSGNPLARLPGPPRGSLPRGTMVQLVDRPVLKLGQGPHAARWRAIVPPPDFVGYVRADAVRWARSTPPDPPIAERRASYEEPIRPPRVEDRKAGPPPAMPADITSELQRIDATYRAILASQPMERWRFESVRVDYQALLKRAGDRPEVEEAIRGRLAEVTRNEQVARAARTIESILERSHRRDAQVARMHRRLAESERVRARAYDAVGFVQPSARKVDGRKVFALIGRDGSTIAYLDIPPGLDTQPLLARRVGIRGQAHFSEDLGTRLITVHDMEGIGARR